MTKELKVKNIFEYISEEVTRQGYDIRTLEGFNRIHCMANAWDYALDTYNRHGRLSHDFIRSLGYRVEPTKNREWSYRMCNVRVGNAICPKSTEVFNLMDNLINKYNNLPPFQSDTKYLDKKEAGLFYHDFEMIHPFEDGNGRVGKILFNYVQRDFLYDPILPPNFWNSSNP